MNTTQLPSFAEAAAAECPELPPQPTATDEQSDIIPPAAQPAVNSLGALRQLEAEPAHAFAMFLKFAMLSPRPSYSDFARKTGLARNTLLRWKDRYRLDDRLVRFYAARHGQFEAAPHRDPGDSPSGDNATATVDLRTEVLKLARHAIHSCTQEQALPITLSGVTRLVELACKLNAIPAAEAEAPRPLTVGPSQNGFTD